MNSTPSSMSRFLLISAALLPSIPASAAVFSGTWTNGFMSSGVVPDGSAAGWFETLGERCVDAISPPG